MKHVVRIEIDVPVDKVAEVFTDPRNATKWMDDVEYEPVDGAPGAPGSHYRLVSKTDDNLTFRASVVARDLPKESRLILDSPAVVVLVKTTFAALPGQRTELVSEETFQFKGIFRKAFSLLARGAIGKAHRGHMESFKRFAER